VFMTHASGKLNCRNRNAERRLENGSGYVTLKLKATVDTICALLYRILTVPLSTCLKGAASHDDDRRSYAAAALRDTRNQQRRALTDGEEDDDENDE